GHDTTLPNTKNCLVPGTGKTRRNRFDKAVTPGKGERLLPESKLCFSDQITYHLTPKTLCYAKT
uniref:hypothetical protein n=1 Tax=Alistipes putredinis TaxID=28117 RepID=UPI003FD70512